MSDAVEDQGDNIELSLYNDEAAQNAFFNAPKITIRTTRYKQKNVRETDEEEEFEQDNYDENTDQELNEKIALHLKEFFNKKITLRNAFENPILDKLPAVAQVEPLQCVGAMLDASARVYAFRVDNTHCECFTVRTNIDEESDDESDEVRSNNDNDEIDNKQNINEKDNDENNAIKKATKKKKKVKIDLELPNRLEDLYKQSNNLVENFIKHTLPSEKKIGNNEITEEMLLKNFDYYSSQMHDIMTSRRVAVGFIVPFIEQKMLGLNRTFEEYNIDDPIYQKVSRHFEEGCAQSFVNNEVLTNDDGSFLILHTNWKNNEPFKTKFTFDSTSSKLHQNDQTLKYIQGAMERTLSSNPNDLQLLQEFCEEEEDKCEKKIEKNSKVRFLGRKSQEISLTRLSESQTLKDGGKDSSESECETTSLIGINDELAKFQMYLDENLFNYENSIKDPFDLIDLFSDDFALNYLHVNENYNNPVHKALLNALTDADALKHFNIKSEVMFEVRKELKNYRKLSQSLLEKIKLEINSNSKLTLFESFVNTKLLCVDDNVENFEEKEKPVANYLVTRFAPLIDSIWHAVIKSASEEDLIKTGIFFGNKNIQRIRQFYQKKNSASRRRKLHVTSDNVPSTIASTPLKRSKVIESDESYNKKFGSVKKIEKKNKLIENSQNSDTDEICYYATPSTSTIETNQKKKRIYFWARPRQYPIVYLGQVIDVRDNPMLQQGVEMCVDMEEMLIGLDEAKTKRVSALSEDINVLEKKNDYQINEIDTANNQFSQHSCNEDNNIIINDPPLDTNFDEKNDENDALPVIDDIFEPQFFDVIDVEDNLNNAINNNAIVDNTEKTLNERGSNAKQNDVYKSQKNAKDESHWKGANVMAIESADEYKEKIKKLKKPKNGPTKTKRRRLSSNTSVEMGGSLTKEMYWDAAEKLDPEILESIKKHQNCKKPIDLVYNLDRRKSGDPKLFLERDDFAVDVAGEYSSLELIQSSLFYKNRFGFWRHEKKGDITETAFYYRPENFKPQSIQEQCAEFMFYYFGRSSNNLDLNLFEQNKNCFVLSGCDFDTNKEYLEDETSDNLNDENENYDLYYNKKNELNDNRYDDEETKNFGWKMEENLEFNGGIIKIRQTKVNAPMIKQAISSILSQKENDNNSLTILRNNYIKEKSNKNCLTINDKELNNFDVANYNNNDKNEKERDLNLNDAEESHSSDSSLSSWSSGSFYEDEQKNDNNQSREIESVENIQKKKLSQKTLTIIGEHTFESVLAHLPERLSGRTKRDLNVINAFSVMLHLCNEQNLRLIQEKDEETLVVKPTAMASFTIQHSKNNL